MCFRKRIEDSDLFPLRFQYEVLNLKIEVGVDLDNAIFTVKLDGIAYRDLVYQDPLRDINTRDGLSGDVILNDVQLLDAATEWEHDTFQRLIESKIDDGAPISKIVLKNLFCESPVVNELMDLLVSQ